MQTAKKEFQHLKSRRVRWGGWGGESRRLQLGASEKQTFMRCKAGCIGYTQGHLIPRRPGGVVTLVTVFSNVSFSQRWQTWLLLSSPLGRSEDTPCYLFAGCHPRASCTGSSPQRATSGVLESSCGRSSPTESSLGSSWATTR